MNNVGNYALITIIWTLIVAIGALILESIINSADGRRRHRERGGRQRNSA